jgi:hypothetical protein
MQNLPILATRCWQALLHRAATGRPFSVLKYAMTADGKIATSTGHSAWVSSTASRQLVFEQRARSDAVIVGGNTVRDVWQPPCMAAACSSRGGPATA